MHNSQAFRPTDTAVGVGRFGRRGWLVDGLPCSVWHFDDRVEGLRHFSLPPQSKRKQSYHAAAWGSNGH